MKYLHRVITWSLLFLLCGMTYLITELSDTHVNVTEMKDTEIALLNLKIAELEGVLIGPHLVESLVKKNGDVLVRVDGNDTFIYAFPRLCRNPGYSGNL